MWVQKVGLASRVFAVSLVLFFSPSVPGPGLPGAHKVVPPDCFVHISKSVSKSKTNLLVSFKNISPSDWLTSLLGSSGIWPFFLTLEIITWIWALSISHLALPEMAPPWVSLPVPPLSAQQFMLLWFPISAHCGLLRLHSWTCKGSKDSTNSV